MPWNVLLTLSVSIELVSSSVKFHKRLLLTHLATENQTHRSDQVYLGPIKIVSFTRNCFQNQLPRWLTCFTQDCDICGKYFTKTTVTMMHKFCHSEAKPSLEGKLRVLWKIVPKNQSPRWVTCLLTQAKSLTNAVIVISVENVYKTAVLKTHKYSHSGVKPFLEGKLWVLRANVFYTNIPDESHVNSHRRKALQTQKCDICGKYISKPLAWRCTNIATVGRSHF